jgi:hypothetical protein
VGSVGKAADFEKHAVCASSPCSRSATVRGRGSLQTVAASPNDAPCLRRFAGALSRQASGATGKRPAKGQVAKSTKCPSRAQASFGRNDPSSNSCANEGPTSEAMLPPALDDFFNSSVRLRTLAGPDFASRSTLGRESRCDLNSKVLFFR